MDKTLGEMIRDLREKKDFSLREFARKLGNISAAHISDIELGRRFPSDELLTKISALLEVPLDELKKCDNRAPVDEIKRLVQSDPAFGFAFRTLVDKKISPDEIMKLAASKPDRGKE